MRLEVDTRLFMAENGEVRGCSLHHVMGVIHNGKALPSQLFVYTTEEEARAEANRQKAVQTLEATVSGLTADEIVAVIGILQGQHGPIPGTDSVATSPTADPKSE